MKATLGRVVEVLRREGIAHALIGAAAMSVRGAARATADDDLLVRDTRVFDPLLWKGLDNVEIRHGDADDPLAGVVRFGNEDESEPLVDVVVPKYLWMDGVLRNATVASYGEVELPVVTRTDLVLLKLFAGGFKDRNDIAMLLALDDDGSLVRDIDARVVELDDEAQTLWREIKAALRR